MVQVKHGDIYNYKTLRKIQDMTYDVDLLPDVNHQSIRSLGSFRVRYAVALPGNLVYKAYMYPDVPKAESGASRRLSARFHSIAWRCAAW